MGYLKGCKTYVVVCAQDILLM